MELSQALRTYLPREEVRRLFEIIGNDRYCPFSAPSTTITSDMIGTPLCFQRPTHSKMSAAYRENVVAII